MQLFGNQQTRRHPLDVVQRHRFHLGIPRGWIIDGKAIHLHAHKNVGNLVIAVKPQGVGPGHIGLRRSQFFRCNAFRRQTLPFLTDQRDRIGNGGIRGGHLPHIGLRVIHRRKEG